MRGVGSRVSLVADDVAPVVVALVEGRLLLSFEGALIRETLLFFIGVCLDGMTKADYGLLIGYFT